MPLRLHSLTSSREPAICSNARSPTRLGNACRHVDENLIHVELQGRGCHRSASVSHRRAVGVKPWQQNTCDGLATSVGPGRWEMHPRVVSAACAPRRPQV